MKKTLTASLAFFGALVLFVLAWSGVVFYRSISYTAEELGIPTLTAPTDFDGDGIDDYTDLMLGARLDAENRPTYDGSYCVGYPADNVGVCTDVIWRAFRNAGYSLRAMVDADVNERTDAYPAVSRPDVNIDYRRVKNLRVFFDTYGVSLTLDPHDTAEWQPGDIVIFGDDLHIGMVSDKRSRNGVAWILHNGGQKEREEEVLTRAEVTGHYRFDASRLDPDFLAEWDGE